MCNVVAYIGRDYGVGEHTAARVIEVISDRLINNGITGATFSDAVGMWCGEIERSVRVELLDVMLFDAHAALVEACADLMQWEIVYTIDGMRNIHIHNDPTAARAACVA